VLDVQLVYQLVTFGLIRNFIALDLEQMRKYHRECIQDWNGCNESHEDNVEDGHFTENGMGNIIEYIPNGLYKKWRVLEERRKSELLVIGRKYSA
jgi:hypothetical protein